MSGTSLDGLDIAHCVFEKKNTWSFNIIKAKTYNYTNEWATTLRNAHKLNAFDLILTHKKYGKYIAEKIMQFIDNQKNIDYIASHGHTIFHQPEINTTFQIGDGATIAAITGLTTICDFRSVDIALNGQGAPLVPIGDKLLFSEYDYCLNFGGFANISFQENKKRIAFDIAPTNFALNYLTNKINLPYDNKGELGKSGEINFELLNELNSIGYYKIEHSKSLSREWFHEQFLPIISKYNISIHNKLRTIYEHIAFQISKILNKNRNSETVFITGGGAYNIFLINLLQTKTDKEIIIPNKTIIDFKEALIFAFLGVLRIRNEKNCLSSVTNSTHDNIGGAVYV